MLVKIGEFSKMNGVSIQTLRYYDRIGLIKPAYIDEASSYRYYDLGQCVLIDTVVYMRSLGYSLKDIHQFLMKSGSQIERIMLHRRQDLIDERQRLDEQIFLLNQYIESYQCYEKNQSMVRMTVESFPKRYAYKANICGSIYSMDDNEYELCLREFKSLILKADLNPMYFNRIGSIINKQDFIDEQYLSNQMFVFVPKHIANYTLPKGDYAVMYVYEFAGEKQLLSIFHKQLLSHGYTPIGDYYCEVVMEKAYLNQEQRSMFIRMQIPVVENPSRFLNT